MDSDMVKYIKCTTLPRDVGAIVLCTRNLIIIIHILAIRKDKKIRGAFIIVYAALLDIFLTR